MRFDGSWHVCPDGRLRPIVYGTVADAEGTRHRIPLMVDTGADATVLMWAVFAELGYDPSTPAAASLEGVGGRANSFSVESPLWLRRETGQDVQFNIPILASAAVDQFGVSILGRDVLNHLTVIVDRKTELVCLLTGHHRYVIQGP